MQSLTIYKYMLHYTRCQVLFWGILLNKRKGFIRFFNVRIGGGPDSSVATGHAETYLSMYREN